MRDHVGLVVVIMIHVKNLRYWKGQNLGNAVNEEPLECCLARHEAPETTHNLPAILTTVNITEARRHPQRFAGEKGEILESRPRWTGGEEKTEGERMKAER